MRPGRVRFRRFALALAIACLGALLGSVAAQAAITLPSGFQDETVFEGLEQPTNFKFAPDGKIFVAEKTGRILVYDGVADKTPTEFANLAKPVYDFEDHGLLGLAIDPMFALGRPYVYALYTFNHTMESPNTEAPLTQEPHEYSPPYPSQNVTTFEGDKCEESENVKKQREKETKEGKTPTAIELEGCIVSGVVVRLTADLETDEAEPVSPAEPKVAKEKTLLYGWCQQATTHSIGELEFDTEGNLLVSGGEGAMYSEPDYGQFGNVCKDPPTPGSVLTHPEAEGGSLRSQSVLRPSGPTLLSGAVLRVSPDTGEGVAKNPFIGSVEKNRQRIIGFGFRQPWRFTVNRRTDSLFVDNVGNALFEEMDRLPLGSSQPYNSGWPCYEGPVKNTDYAERAKPILRVCKEGYEEKWQYKASDPFFSYDHNGKVAPGDPCGTPSKPGAEITSDIGGLAFYEGSDYPAEYKNSLFFSDPIRGCIYDMQVGAGGEPNPAAVTPFLRNSEKFAFPGVAMHQGPEGNIFYNQLFGAGGGSISIHRLVYPRPVEPEVPVTPPVTPTPTPPVPAPPTPVPTPAPPKIEKRPGKTTASTTARFVFSGDKGMRFRCKIDGKSFSSCRSPRTYKHLKPGQHQFRVYALDASGERGKVTIFRWKIVKP